MPLDVRTAAVPAGTVTVERFQTPAGFYLAAWAGDTLVFGITGPGAEVSLNRWLREHGLRETPGKPRLEKAMRGYFAGKPEPFAAIRVGFISGTPFQHAVWSALAEIPFGKVTTYGTLAEKIGRPGSGRPVGQAVGANPITIVLPCHRVVGSTGALTGFGCGLPVKRILLRNEGWALTANDRLVIRRRTAVSEAGFFVFGSPSGY